MINPIKASSINKSLPKGSSYFICNSSYEDRCLVAAKSISKTRIKHAYIFVNKEFWGCTNQNTAALCETLKCGRDIIRLSNSNPIETADSLVQVISNIISNNDKPNLIIDCTTFTRESLLILVKIVLINRSSLGDVKFVYVAASVMNDAWLSKGIISFRSVLGFAGDFSPSKDLHLVILLGFEIERAREIIEQYEPSLISIGIGDKHASITDMFYKSNLKFLEELTSYYGNRPLTFTYSLTDPNDTKNDLSSYLSKFKKFNTVIAPLNNKLSTIGAGLFANEYPATQLCYTQMGVYNIQDYSLASDQCYIFSL